MVAEVKPCHPSMSVCLSVQLCFASLLAAPRTTLHNVVGSLFLRVLHSFAENVLMFAATHEVGSVPWYLGCLAVKSVALLCGTEMVSVSG